MAIGFKTNKQTRPYVPNENVIDKLRAGVSAQQHQHYKRFNINLCVLKIII